MIKINLSIAINRWTAVIFAVFTLFGCKVFAQNDLNDSNVTPWPLPSSFIKDIPVYEKFDQIEPIFHLDNDTTYIINFWATWCKPCVEELPYFEELTTKYEEKKVKVILCSLDFPKQLESKLVPFVEKHELQSTVIALLDGKFNNWIDKVSPEWDGTIPATYIYRGDKHHFIGLPIKNTEELEEVIQTL